MQPQFQSMQTAGSLSTGQNRVLRNTYLMLAVSMVPTLLGALVGIQMRFSLFAGSPLISFLVFMGIAWGFMWGIERNKNSGLGVALLLGFTFFMGLMLSRVLQVALGFSNGGSIIAMAAGGTAVTFFVLSSIASSTKRDFSNMGTFLTVGMVVILLAIVANIFLEMPGLSLAISAGVVLISAAWMLYDVQRIVRGGETNYVSASLSVYLNLYNMFISLLNLLMALTGQRD
ncbi:MAG TPA: Bax inhibitor-1/YccA family protein [Methyloversatilis sp.]